VFSRLLLVVAINAVVDTGAPTPQRWCLLRVFHQMHVVAPPTRVLWPIQVCQCHQLFCFAEVVIILSTVANVRALASSISEGCTSGFDGFVCGSCSSGYVRIFVAVCF
jgi:hypothetical protein